MKFNKRTEFMPLEPVHPTDLIMDEINARNWDCIDVAKRLDMPANDFINIIVKKQPITESMAYKLQEVFNISASMWLNLQNDYDKIAKLKLVDREVNDTYNLLSEALPNLEKWLIIQSLGIKPIRVKGKWYIYYDGGDISRTGIQVLNCNTASECVDKFYHLIHDEGK